MQPNQLLDGPIVTFEDPNLSDGQDWTEAGVVTNFLCNVCFINNFCNEYRFERNKKKKNLLQFLQVVCFIY